MINILFIYFLENNLLHTFGTIMLEDSSTVNCGDINDTVRLEVRGLFKHIGYKEINK